jgi:hypothetical protein
MARKKPAEPDRPYKLTLVIKRSLYTRFRTFASDLDEGMSEVFTRVMKREMTGFKTSHPNRPEVQSEGEDGGTIRMDDKTSERKAG